MKLNQSPQAELGPVDQLAQIERTWETWLFDPLVGRFTAVLLGIVGIAVFVKVAQRILGRTLVDPDSRYRARKAITFLGYGLAIILVATVFSDRLGQTTVALGVAGAGIAFALQEVIASVAGWLAVAGGGFYRIGDRVQLGGIKGDVIDIGILRTTLMETGGWVDGDLYNGRVVRIANSFVFKEPVYNYSGDFPFLWEEVRIPVKFGSDRALARQILLSAAMEVSGEFPAFAAERWSRMVHRYRLEEATLDPMVTLVVNDNWLEFTARFVVDYKRRRSVKDRFFETVMDAIDGSDGKVALASATFHLVEMPEVHVALSRSTG